MEYEVSFGGHDQIGRKREKRRRKGNERKKRKREKKKECECVCVCVYLNLENTLGVHRFMDPCPNYQG